ENVTSEARAVGNEGHDDAHGDGHEHRNGDAMRDEEPPVGDGDVVGFGIAADNADRPWIGIGDPDGAQYCGAGHGAEKDFGPERTKGKLEPPPLAPSVQQHECHCDAAGQAYRPAPECADGARGTASHELEGSIERGDGLAVGNPPGRSAPHQQAAQCDDEGRNFEIGNDEALNRTYDQAEGYAYEEGNQPDPGIAQFETHLLHENARLHHAHYHADETLDRTD